MGWIVRIWDFVTSYFVKAIRTIMTLPTPSATPSETFDIHQSYLHHLTSDTNPQPPHLASISALLTSLKHPSHKSATATEALSVLSSQAQKLKDALDAPGDSSRGPPKGSAEDSPSLNKISSRDSTSSSNGSLPASAGLDLFLHYLINNVIRAGAEAQDARRSGDSEGTAKEKAREIDEALKSVHTVGEAFIQRGLRAREQIVKQGRRIIRDGSVVVLPAPGDEVVRGVVRDAVDAGVDFGVVMVGRGVGDGVSSREEARGKAGLRGELEDAEVPFIVVPSQALGSTLRRLASPQRGKGLLGTGKYDRLAVMAPAAAVLADGGVWVEEGVVQAFMLAGLLGVETVIVSELGKMVRALSGSVNGGTVLERQAKERSKQEVTSMDVLEARYITMFLTEHGVMVPNAVAEEAVRVWF